MSKPLSVVLLPPEADRSLASLVEISQHQLAHRVVVVTGRGESVVVEDGVCTPVDVIQFLARQRPSLIRLISVGFATASGFASPTDHETFRAELAERALQANLPMVAIAIAVPHETARAPGSFFATMWNANVVVAPEDNAGSAGMISVPLTVDKAEHVALAFALLAGGVWSWMQEGVFDDAKIPAAAGEVYAELARGVTRVVDAGDLPARIISWALNSGGAWPVPPECVPHGSPQALIDALVARLAPQLQFVYHPLPEPERSRPTELSLFGALKLFFGEVVSSLRAMPGRAWRSLKARVLTRVEQLVQEKTFGDDSAVVVRIEGAARSVADLVGSTRRVGQLAELPSIEVPGTMPNPDTWRNLMAVLFSLVDGGDATATLPDADRQWQGRRAVLTDRTLVVPYAESGVSTGFQLSTGDLTALGLATSPDETATLGGVDVSSARLVERQISAMSTAVDPSATSGQDASTGQPTEEVGLPMRFARWRASRERSLLWRLASVLADCIEKALHDVASADEKLNRLRKELEQYHQEEERLLRRRRRGVLIGLLWVVAVIAGAVFGYMRWSLLGAGIGFVVLVASIVGLAVKYMKIAADEVRLKHRLGELEARPAWLLKFRQHAASEATRLASMNDQLIEWADVYSHLVHHPWGDFSAELSSEPWRTTIKVLSFTCGSPSIDDERVQGEVMRLRRQVCRTGWLSAVYSDLASRWRDRYSIVAAVDPSNESAPEADTSDARDPLTVAPATGEAVYRPRQQLANDVVNGRFTALLLAAKVEALRTTIARTEADELVQQVECDIEGLTGLDPERFLTSLVSQSPLPQFPQQFVQADITQTPQVARSLFAISDAIEFSPPTDAVERRRIGLDSVADRFVLASFRLDLTHSMTIDKLAPLVEVGSGPTDTDHVGSGPGGGIG